MNHPYLPLTERERKQMEKAIGINSIEKLFAMIPPAIRNQASFELPAYKEFELKKIFSQWAKENTPVSKVISFLGAGAYEHAIPSALEHLVSRSEFYTAYTPYQPEINQGLLQAFFEYQSLISDLTGMDITNASMYDGPTALAEAVILALRYTKKSEVIVLPGLNPEAEQVLHTYTRNIKVDLRCFPYEKGNKEEILKSALNDQTAAVVIQNPDFFGNLSPLTELISMIHDSKALAIVYVNDPVSLGILEPPGTQGADLVVGEAQAFGLPLSFGGPYLGFFSAKKEFLRNIPGRLVGKTTDLEGKEGFVLTLQTREQHIRRERASSNICSNQALCALAATIYLALLGPVGLKEVAWSTAKNSHYFFSQLTRIPSIKTVSEQPFFHEFTINLGTNPAKILPKLTAKGFLPGYSLEKYAPEYTGMLLLYTSELRTKEEMDKFCEELEGCLP